MTAVPQPPKPGLGLDIELLSDESWDRIENAVFEELDRVAEHSIPIEPLSARSWDRVEDGVFDALDLETTLHLPVMEPPSRWRPALTITGFGMAAAAAAIALFALTSREAPLHSSRVETAEAVSRVTHGEASLVVAPESALVMSGDDERGLLVVLERGSVDCSVPPRRGRPRFAVQAGDVRVEVIGTRFAVSRDGDGAAVSVTEGVVEVIFDGESTKVRAGERWPAIRTAAGPDVDIIESEIAIMEPEIFDSRPTATRKRRPRRQRVRQPEPEPAPAPAPAPARKPTMQERFATAQSLEAEDPEAAVAIYAKLADGSGPWAAAALYQHAELALYQGKRQTGLRLLRKYLARFPDGPNAADARALLDANR